MNNNSMKEALSEEKKAQTIRLEKEMEAKTIALDKEIEDKKKSHQWTTDGFGQDGIDNINLLFDCSIDIQETQEKIQEWSKPKPLEEEHILPPFPLDCLPKTVRQYVESVAESTATAVDMAAVASLAVVASTVQKKYQIKGKAGWYEPLNIYAVIIADPGERKSSVMREMTECVKDYERAENAKRVGEMDMQAIQLTLLSNQVQKNIKSRDLDEANSAQKELRELESVLIKPLRLIADDVTPESLTTLLAENNGALSIISAEGGFFDILAGRYSSTACIDTVLKAHSGDDIHVDRKGRASEYIQHPSLTMLLAVQNDVIQGLFENGVFTGRGLTARVLYCKPTSTIGTRRFETNSIPPEVKKGYDDILYNLLDLPFPVDGNTGTIEIDNVARSSLDSYFNDIEKRLIGDLEDMRGWASKLIGATLRIAGILHAMDYKKLTNNDPVNQITMLSAIEITSYFLEHSKAVYQLMGIDEEAKKLRFVLKKLEDKPQEQYKKYDIYKMSRNAYIKTVGDIDQTLLTLVEYGYLKEIITEDNGRSGRKSATSYKLNPLHFKL